MTRSELTSLALNKISGSHIASADLDIHEASMRAAIDVAIRYFYVANYRESRRESFQSNGRTARRESGVSPGFVKKFVLDVYKENERSPAGDTRLYVQLESNPFVYQKMKWLNEVYPYVEGLNPHDYIGGGFRILEERKSLRGIDTLVMQGIGFAYPEVIGSDFRIYLFNALPIVEKAVVYYVPDPSSIDENEELFLPNGIDMMIIDKACEFFREPRLMPADLVIDEKDDATKVVRR